MVFACTTFVLIYTHTHTLYKVINNIYKYWDCMIIYGEESWPCFSPYVVLFHAGFEKITDHKYVMATIFIVYINDACIWCSTQNFLVFIFAIIATKLVNDNALLHFHFW